MIVLENKSCEIWAVGGGKGGIGKSFIISSIGITLARQGKKVILVDADLGGANLHTFLGLGRPKVTLTDFFDKKSTLPELITETGIPNLGLLTGALNSLSIDSIKHAQKRKLFHHIKDLDADFVLIDLGAGTHFNTLDSFLLADKMVAVIVPEMISIENMYFFLKNVFFRKLMAALAEEGLKDMVTTVWNNRHEHSIENRSQLIKFLQGESEQCAAVINRELAQFTIHLLLNKSRSGQDITVGNAAKSVCKKYFDFDARYIGHVDYDEMVSNSINKRQPYLLSYPTSKSARDIEKIVKVLLHG
ncbi:MinD/ParA family protein [Thermodesulfobacteriota bacterium]